MILKRTKIEGAFLIEPTIYKDCRGEFYEGWNKMRFELALGRTLDFTQMNKSKSKKGVLRGLHYQCKKPQAKLVSVTKGEVLDVFVDLRTNSPTFGIWDSMELSGDKKIFIPEGCAHGFLVLSEEADFQYLVSDYRSPEYEVTLLWNDSHLKIDWSNNNREIITPILSEKDSKGLSWEQCPKF
jgi:dTDP-4-dehydrorhamnose 3,5-epimerase